MFKFLDPNAQIPILCPGCKNEFSRTAGEMNQNPQFACPRCGTLFEAEDLLKGLKEADEKLADLAGDLGGKFGRK